MKKYYFISIGLLFLFSCTTTDEPTIDSCSPTTVTIFNNSESVYDFTDGNLVSIDAAIGTDENAKFAYSYTDGLINNISSTDIEGVTLVYDAVYSGSNLSKLIYKQPGGSNSLIELRYIYNGDKVSSYESWYANGSGTLFQIGHTAFGYDGNNNLVQSETNFDLAAFFTLAFGSDPTGYAPQTLFVYEYVPSNSVNPLYRSYSFNNLEYSIMKNLPASYKITDLDGNISSESFEFEADEDGNTTNATGSGQSYLTAAYLCDQ